MAEPPRTKTKPRRGWATVLVLLALVIVVARLLLPDAVGEQVRRSFEEILSQHYPGMQVRVRSGRFEPGVGVILSGIEIRDRTLPAAALPLMRIHRVVVETDWDPASLKERRAPVAPRRVVVDGATVNLWPVGHEGWSVQPLWPPPEMGPGCPLITVTRSRVRLCRDWRSDRPALELAGVQAELRDVPTAGGHVRKEIRVLSAGEFVERVSISASISPEGVVASGGTLAGVRLDERLLERMPPAWKQRFRDASGLSAVAEIRWRTQGDSHNPLHDWIASVRLDSGRFTSPELPIEVDHLRGLATLRPTGIHIESSECSISGATVRAHGTIGGLQWPCPVAMTIDAENLMLDASLSSLLPARLRAVDDELRPRGRVDIRGHVGFQDLAWNLDTEITCNGVSISPERFPYPITDVQGVVRYRGGVASSESLRLRAGDATLNCAFTVSPPEQQGPYWIDVRGDRPMRIDDTLIQALTPRGESTSELEEFVRSLAPGGAVHVVHARLERDAAGNPTKQIDLRIHDGRLRYAKFPYPLYEVRGRLRIDDAGVRLEQFQAQNHGGARVECEGHWLAPRGTPQGTLALDFRGFGVPLEDGLRTALPASARQTWDTLAPAGVLDRLEVHVANGPFEGPPQLTIVAQQWADESQGHRALSVTPATLPYRLDITRGMVRMEGDSIVISDMDAFHGSSRVSAEGHCQRRPDGRWQLDLNLLTGSRLRPDAELVGALPTEIRGSFAKLQLREPVSLRGTTQLILPTPELPVPIVSWDLLLQLEGNRIGDTGPVHDIRGEIQVRGQTSGPEATADGFVRIDSMHVYDVQLTAIEGPFQIRGPRLMLGIADAGGDAADVPRVGTAAPAVPEEVPIRGQVFGGDIAMRGQVMLSSGQFDVHFDVRQASVATLLADLDQPHADLTGQFGGTAHLEGNLGAANLLRGTAKAHLTEANLYQLPLIVQVFNQLRLTPAEEVGFTDGAADVAIDGDTFTFNELQLWGDLVALHGAGTLNGRREMDLILNTRVSPHNAWGRLLRPLRSQKYTLWTINVRGPLADPKIERRALEAMNETLERLFPVMERRPSEPADPAAAPPPNDLRAATRRPLVPRISLPTLSR